MIAIRRSAAMMLAGILMLSSALAGSYRWKKLEDMISEVNTIAMGKVLSVEPPTITVELTEVYAGCVERGALKLNYYLPPLEQGGVRYYWDLPGSGIETRLAVGSSYIFLLHRGDTYRFLRAERMENLHKVLEAWRQTQTNNETEQDTRPHERERGHAD